MSGRAGDVIGDAVILQQTAQEQDGSKVRLKFTLQSGKDVTSEWMQSEQLKGGVLIAWCESIRGAISHEVEEAEALAKRGDMDVEAVAEVPSAATAHIEAVTGTPNTDPDEFILMQMEAARTVLHKLRAQHHELHAQVAEAEAAASKWELVGESLGITLGEDNEFSGGSNSEDSTEERTSDTDGSGDTVRDRGTDDD